MNEKNKTMINSINDNELENISGGLSRAEIYIPKPIISNNSTYSSGSTPKYSVGQQIYIECDYVNINKIRCEILAVSATRVCGTFCKEFGYKIRILDSIGAVSPVGDLKGMELDGVYESCIYTD